MPNSRHGIASALVLMAVATGLLLRVGEAQGRIVSEKVLADSQLQALNDLFQSTGGSNWINSTGWTSNDDPCGRKAGNSPWYGISCSGGYVTKLLLNKNALGGTLPNSISNLLYVQGLHFRSNLLIGGIPSTLGDIQTLQTLDLSYNHFSGIIPSLGSNSTSLTYLYLGNNQLGGTIPSSFQSLSGLAELDLSNNRLTGEVPGWLASLALTSLWVPYNNLSGKFPLNLCQSLILCSAAFNQHLMCPSMSCTCGAMQSCNCNYLCQNSGQCTGLCSTCVGASPFMNGYCK